LNFETPIEATIHNKALMTSYLFVSSTRVSS